MASYLVTLDRSVDIQRDRRAWRYDLDDLDEALSVIRRSEGRGVEVTVEEPDGYRHRVRT